MQAKCVNPFDRVVFDGEVLRFPWCYDDVAVRQVRFNVDWVRKYLGAYAPEGLLIQPVIVVPGWYVAPTGVNVEVKVMNAKYLVGYLKSAERLYKPEQLTTVIQRLDDGCRSLEF